MHLNNDVLSIIFEYIHEKKYNTIKPMKILDFPFERYAKLFPIICRSDITDNGLHNLKGVHTIDLSHCDKITDNGLEYLKGVHTINLSHYYNITDNGLEYLKGVHTINLWNCKKITYNGLQNLKGVHTIYLWFVMK